MNTEQSVERDERTVAVENASHKWAYGFIAFALLIDVAYRAAVRNEAAWDLMALVIVGGAISFVYQVRQKTLGQGWVWKMTLSGFIAAIVAAVIVAILAMTKAM
jgi:hypothetical protein